MYKKSFFGSIILISTSFTVCSTSQWDIPKAKKCYAICEQLEKIQAKQEKSQCIDKLQSARNNTELGALKIAEDDGNNNPGSARPFFREAQVALKHALMYDCNDEEGIIEAGNEIWNRCIWY